MMLAGPCVVYSGGGGGSYLITLGVTIKYAAPPLLSHIIIVITLPAHLIYHAATKIIPTTVVQPPSNDVLIASYNQQDINIKQCQCSST